MTSTALSALKSRARGVSLGLFAADLGDLRAAAQGAAGWGCGIAHFDIMDGVFVPQMVGGPGFVKALDCGMLRDVHLMVENPARHVETYIKAGADMITVHAESNGAAQAIGAIQASARPVMAGLALMPGTTLEQAAPLLTLNPDMILVLSLDPRGTPVDISAACARLRKLRALAPDAVLGFDGGVTLNSIDEIAACQPDMVVSGSAVMGADHPEHAFTAMVKAVETANT